MQGLTGLNDMRDIRKALEAGNQAAALALDIYAYRIQKYIGSYAAVLNGLDALIFTAGVGENDSAMREQICANLDFLAVYLDSDKNRVATGDVREVNRPDSAVKILVIPTNEELEIAQQSFDLLETA